MSLYICFDLVEHVIGRDGPSVRAEDIERIQRWVAEPDGQRCVTHAILIHKRLEVLQTKAEPAIHVPKALFSAGLIIYLYAKFRPPEASHGEIDVPELRLSEPDHVSAQNTGEPAIFNLAQFDLTALFSVADLLRRLGHWGVSRKFSSILEPLLLVVVNIKFIL